MTAANCPSGDALAAYAEGIVAAEVAEHVRDCSDCSAVVEILQQLEALDMINEVDRYLNDVGTLLDDFESTPREGWPELLADAAYQRADLARRLLARGLDARWRDAALAIDLTRAAATIAEALRSDAADLADLRFDSWKYHSALLRESGRYEDCRGALVRAEEAADHTTDVELARASILLSRALLAIEPDVWEPEEARASLDLVEPIYLRRDTDRWRHARDVRAHLLCRAGDSTCVALFEEVLAGTSDRARDAYNDSLANLIVARVEFGDASPDIDEYLARIEAHDRTRNATALLARDEWLRGRLDALRQRHEPAVERFRNAIAQYRGIGNDDAAVRVGIDAVASLIVIEEYDEATELCRELAAWSAHLDEHEPSRRRALTAEVTHYLRELAQRSILTVDVVAEVRRYVHKITNQRPFPFVPPIPVYPV